MDEYGDAGYEQTRRRRFNFFGAFRKIDRRVLVLAAGSVLFFGLLYYKKIVSGTTLIIIGAFLLFLLLIIGGQETERKVLEANECIVILKKKLEDYYNKIDKDCEVRIENKWILYHWDGLPKSYDILWTEIENRTKYEKTYVTEIDAYTGNLIKNREATAGWNAQQATNTIVDKIYVPEGKIFDAARGKK